MHRQDASSTYFSIPTQYLDIVNLLKAFPLGVFPPDPRADQNGPGSDVTMAQPGSSLTTSAHKNF